MEYFLEFVCCLFGDGRVCLLRQQFFWVLFRHTLINSKKRHFLNTICYEHLSTPAYLGRNKHKHIL